MNHALSLGRPGRHPAGLMIVVGLHAVLAAALLTARLQAVPAEPQPIELHPIDPPTTVVPRKEELPQPPTHAPRLLVLPLPVVEPDRPDTIAVLPHDQTPADRPEPTFVALQDKPHDPVRVTPRNGRLDAGARECRPEYPAVAQRLGVTGTSRIRFSVDAAGHILGAQILQSSGPSRENRLLDQAAAAALATCPVTLGNDDQGRAVPFTTDIDYVWTMN